MNLKQYCIYYLAVLAAFFLVGVDDFSSWAAEAIGAPQELETIKLGVYLLLACAGLTVVVGAIIDLVYGKGTFRLD